MSTGMETRSRGATGEPIRSRPFASCRRSRLEWRQLAQGVRSPGTRTRRRARPWPTAPGPASLTAQTLLRALVLGRVLEREWGPAAAFRADGSPHRARRGRQPGGFPPRQDPGQPQLLGQPGPGRFLDRPVPDHARPDLVQGARSIQDHSQGTAHPARRHPREGATDRQALGRRRRQAGADRRSCRASCPGSRTKASTQPQP